MEKNNATGLPNWILFLFLGALLWGLLYGIFYHGFLNENPENALLDETGTFVVRAEVQIPDRTADAVTAGETAYKTACIACHGPNREGGVGPSLADATWLHGDKESDIFRVITTGISAADSKTGQIMPPMGGASLSKAQAWQILYFLADRNGSIKKGE
ncbi:MAG: c-type cytochrome [Spirochaetales bacterium]|nr:c-type cytochrome [Spirochaetales bacterium]